MRRANALKRDFTVNALMYDPFSQLLYDYVGGVQDCTNRTLRTLGDPVESFQQVVLTVDEPCKSLIHGCPLCHVLLHQPLVVQLASIDMRINSLSPQDPVRIVRAIRLAARLGLTIDKDTVNAITTCRDLVSTLNPVRCDTLQS